MRDFLPIGIGMMAAIWLGFIVLALHQDRLELAALAFAAFIVTMIGGFVWAREAGYRDAEERAEQRPWL